MKVFLDSVGCRLNQSEIESYARQFQAAGHMLVASPEEAELFVLNTCTVTAPAASDSRQKIRQARKAGIERIVVTGCWSSLEADAAASMPGVIRVVPNERKDRLVPELLQIEVDDFDLEPLQRVPVPGDRGRTRAFIKVQDGCDNHCTFCITTLARGPGRSRSLREVLADVQAAYLGGAKEAVLTGVHLGSWGYDFSHPGQLSTLVRHLLTHTDIPRLRLSSLEPWDLDESFFELWDDPRLCRHLHLPLQSGSSATLRRMARKTTPAAYASLVSAARRAIPDLAVTSDIIAGFPGETDAEFEENLAFVERMQFAGAHVFTYSARPGTAAASMPYQVHHALRKERNQRLRAAVAASQAEFQAAFIGRELPVLWEKQTQNGDSSSHFEGLSDNYLRVSTSSALRLWNEITPTRLDRLNGDGLIGRVEENPASIWFAAETGGTP